MISYSLYLWIKLYFENKTIKQLRHIYPNGFSYKDESYFTTPGHGELPALKTADLILFNSIDISNLEKESDGPVSIQISDPTSYY